MDVRKYIKANPSFPQLPHSTHDSSVTKWQGCKTVQAKRKAKGVVTDRRVCLAHLITGLFPNCIKSDNVLTDTAKTSRTSVY